MSWKRAISHFLRGQRTRAARPEAALPFCATLALEPDTGPLLAHARAGPAPRALAALIKRREEEEEHPPAALWEIRQKGLSERSRYALDALEECAGFNLVVEARQLIATLEELVAIDNVEALMVISAYRTSGPEKSGARAETHPLSASARSADISSTPQPAPGSGDEQEDGAPLDIPSPEPDWLSTGWETLDSIRAPLTNMPDYRELTAHDARRDFLALKIKQLREVSMGNLPAFWQSIGGEIIDDWVAVLENEAKQAREWLKMAVRLPDQHPTTGAASLLLELVNESQVVARDIRLDLDSIPGLHWVASTLHHRLLEGGKSVSLSVNMNCDEAGSYPMTGSVEAQDLEGTPYQSQFSFRLPVGETGAPYVPPDIQPYQVGEGLGSDLTFVGRSELLDELRSLWRQSHGKPAVVLVGQRRIGKTSLLNKIRRDTLAEMRLHPLVIDIQGSTSAYDFLTEVANGMAEAIAEPKPALDRQEAGTYADFKRFLSDITPRLAGWRFLLMLDEADLLLRQHLGVLMPGFLRSLMQDPQYPILLLFCGTYALKRIGREHSSILFNTTHEYAVGYMNEMESHEVLKKPAHGILEFSQATLERAYHFTRGQPMLLQKIGETLIRQFNSAFFAGETRGNYVSLDDLERAVKEIIAQEGNAAFENHWNDNDTETRRVLSGLAWALDETNRPQLNATSIAAALEEAKLSVPHRRLLEILERLREEEVLLNDGAAYRFAVPLYRRWIAWRWDPASAASFFACAPEQSAADRKDGPLESGASLHEDGYQIVSVPGQGAFGITYRAKDTKLGYDIAIKEYFPRDLVHRGGDGGVYPNRERDEEAFKRGVRRFYDGARILARFTKQPDAGNIARVYNYFEENGTAYMVMEYQEGENLSTLERETPMEERKLRLFFRPVLDSLRALHESGIFHRNITPQSILVRKEDGAPVLLDFGIAREAAIGDLYSPPELFQENGSIGPWTDIFSMGAVLYRLIGGELPSELAGRHWQTIGEGGREPLKKATDIGNGRYSPSFLHAIDRALRLDAGERPRDIGQWIKIMEGKPGPEEEPSEANANPIDDDSIDDDPIDDSTRGNTEDTPGARVPPEIPSPASPSAEVHEKKSPNPGPEPGVAWKYVDRASSINTFGSDGVLRAPTPKVGWGIAASSVLAKTEGRKFSSAFGSHVLRSPPPIEPFSTGDMPTGEKRAVPKFVSGIDESERDKSEQDESKKHTPQRDAALSGDASPAPSLPANFHKHPSETREKRPWGKRSRTDLGGNGFSDSWPSTANAGEDERSMEMWPQSNIAWENRKDGEATERPAFRPSASPGHPSGFRSPREAELDWPEDDSADIFGSGQGPDAMEKGEKAPVWSRSNRSW